MFTVKNAIDALKAQGTQKITCHALGYKGRLYTFNIDDADLIPYYHYQVSHFSSAGRYGENEFNTCAVGSIVYLAEGFSDKWIK